MNNFKKAFTFVEITLVMFILTMTLYILRDFFFAVNMQKELKKEANKIVFITYKHILDIEYGYLSTADSSCGGMTFANISVNNIKQCVTALSGGFSDRLMTSAVSAGCASPLNDNVGLCSHFVSERVIPFEMYIEENPTNSNQLYLYFRTSDTNSGPRNVQFFEQFMYGYLANQFSHVLANEVPEANWDGQNALSTDITTEVSTSTQDVYEKDGMFMLTINKI